MESELNFKSFNTGTYASVPGCLVIFYTWNCCHLPSILFSLFPSLVQGLCFPCYRWLRSRVLPEPLVPKGRVIGQEWVWNPSRVSQSPFLRDSNDTEYNVCPSETESTKIPCNLELLEALLQSWGRVHLRMKRRQRKANQSDGERFSSPESIVWNLGP